MAKKRYNVVDAIRYSPYRSVRWRFDRVIEILDMPDARKRYPLHGADDDWTKGAYIFIKKWEDLADSISTVDMELARRELANVNFPMYQAHEIAMSPDGDKIKGEIEARILANQDDASIADKIGIFPESIEWYEKIFFNVRDRLHNTGYIVSNAIGPLVSAGFASASVELTAKFFGYMYRNNQLMEQILFGINKHISPPGEGQDTLAFLDSTIENMVETLVLRTAQSMEPNKFDAKELLLVWKDLMALRRQASGSDMARTNIEENVAAFLGSISWGTGRSRQQLLEASPLDGYANQTAELRAEEQVALMSGLADKDELEAVVNRKLPPPRKEKTFDPDGIHKPKKKDSD